jgi:SEC-C motif domain protein
MSNQIIKNRCFCGSDNTFEQCCKPIIDGTQPAPTAQALMRSRYSAYVIIASQYLIDSTHISQRANYSKTDIEAWAKESNWQKLEIIDCKKGLSDDSVGEIEFNAYYHDSKNILQIHHEKSIFKKESGDWFYVNGTIIPSKSIINRNDACACGSGKKFKKCCGR